MFIDKLPNKAVSFPKARAKKIRHLCHSYNNFERTLLKIYSYYKLAEHWEELSPAERITLESMWTDSMLKLLLIGNSNVMRSIRYRLREQTPEEDALDGGLD